MKTDNGLEFKIISASELIKFDGYDKCVAECHIRNCGRIIIDAIYEQPIDNEYDLEEIYSMLTK